MKISLYTANIFYLGQEVMFTKHTRNYEKDLLRSKKLDFFVCVTDRSFA